MQPLAFIPSPSQGVWHLGPFPLRAYAFMIIIGIVIAVWVTERRWTARGGEPGVVVDVAVWAVPFGLVGGRLYHVITDWQRYFGSGGDPLRSLMIWEGGLGIWGAIILGALGAALGCRRRGISALALADAAAPGVALAQAVGRWGNYWNQELYGRPLHTFWALEIDPEHREAKYADVATYHPTFLYESIWCVGVAVLVVWAGRRWNLTHGRTFALYVAAYTAGRGWVEALRVDEAHHVLGLRLNDWTSIVIFLLAVAYLYFARNRSGPERIGAVPDGDGPAAEPATTPDASEDATKADETAVEKDAELPTKADGPAPETDAGPPTAVDEPAPVKDAEPAPADEPTPAEEAEPATAADEPASEKDAEPATAVDQPAPVEGTEPATAPDEPAPPKDAEPATVADEPASAEEERGDKRAEAGETRPEPVKDAP
ncbi:Prolipoprotein diacylglyceryl transferase [Actinomadura rubteroloni]|uniref:Phosphatidylglycerol--prolipoprotein diacylglyceryl transferase n=1 Tax=Actinomadura rubteroloni TaxID=1926885 RepID=A0A2P4UFT7_9ACTN|nr:prolipoprotein diacylglyceryl transferase [Actinomadura rubteroloni]POM23944.1 Prolipoprotein diacylglyceryl transferase [Actinomadura rubteroloni]